MAWLAMAMALPVAAARAQTFLTAPVNLSGTGRAVIPSIAAGPNGEIDVVWLDSFNSGAILFRRTLDGGKTFSATMTVATTNLPSQASQPEIAVNSAGVYVAWAGTNGSGGGDIFVSALASGGNGFSAPVNVSGGKGIASASSAPVPHMAAEPGGAVDIVWGQSAAYFARSTDGGNTFPTVTPLSTSPMQRVSPRIAIGAQGNIDVVWVKADPNFPNCSSATIQFARLTGSGVLLGVYSVADNLMVNQQPITGCTSDVQIAPGAKNTIHLLWANENPQIQDLIVTYATDDDSTFSGRTDFPETPSTFFNISTTASHTPEMAIDSSGNINVVWMGDVKLNDPNEIVYFSRSTNGGNNFTNPKALMVASASGAKSTGFAQIALEPGGPIDILWQQASAANPDNAYDIVLARSTDGTNFKPFTLDNSPTMTGNTGQLAVDGNGNVYALWLGNSGSNADILLNGDSNALADPGFSLTVSASGQTVLPGSSVNYTVTVNSIEGFNQSVTLSCSGEPTGAACSFNPGTVMLSSSSSSTLTVTLPATIAAGTYSLTVMGAAGGVTQTASAQFVVGGLTASISPASATISVGGSGSFTVSLTSTGSFAGNVTLACSAPAGVSCSFNPGSVSLVSGAASATMNVGVSVKPSASADQRGPGADSGRRPQRAAVGVAWMWGICAVLFFATLAAWKRSRNALALVLLLAAVATGLVSCGGSTKTSGGGGGGGGSITFPMTVQGQSNSATMNLQTISITVP